MQSALREIREQEAHKKAEIDEAIRLYDAGRDINPLFDSPYTSFSGSSFSFQYFDEVRLTFFEIQYQKHSEWDQIEIKKLIKQ